MPHFVIGRYTVTHDLSFVNILLSLFVIVIKMGKLSFSYSTCKFWYNPVVVGHAAQHRMHLTAFGVRLRASLANWLFDLSTYLSQSGGR